MFLCSHRERATHHLSLCRPPNIWPFLKCDSDCFVPAQSFRLFLRFVCGAWLLATAWPRRRRRRRRREASACVHQYVWRMEYPVHGAFDRDGNRCATPCSRHRLTFVFEFKFILANCFAGGTVFRHQPLRKNERLLCLREMHSFSSLLRN